MQTVLWFAGVCLVWTSLKFVFMVFRRLGSKNSMDGLIDRMEDGMETAADSVAGYYKKKRSRKRKEKEQPIVEIH